MLWLVGGGVVVVVMMTVGGGMVWWWARKRKGWRQWSWLLVAASLGLLGLVVGTGILIWAWGGMPGNVWQSPPDESTLATRVAAILYAEQTTQAQTFTATPTPTSPPTVTPTPMPTPTQTPALLAEALVKAEVVDVWAGPGVGYDIAGQAQRGDALQVTGRNATGDWLAVITSDGTPGWVAAMWLQLDVPLDSLATATIPPTPTHTPNWK